MVIVCVNCSFVTPAGLSLEHIPADIAWQRSISFWTVFNMSYGLANVQVVVTLLNRQNQL